MKTALLTLLILILSFSANAQLVVAKLFGDHMVLQRDQVVPVWGWSTREVKVHIKFNGQFVSAKADDNGYWKAILKPMPAGGPYSMNITADHKQLVYVDLMIGEVWLCSGQSNMEFQLKNAYGYKAEQKIAPEVPVRQFHVPDKISLTPEKDLSGGQWVKADTGTVGEFTAVGYFFAKKLAKELHVTIGLIHSSWGGTQVEDWISKDAMLTSPELGAVAKALPDNFDALKQRVDKQLKRYAYRNQPVVDYAAAELAAQPASFFDTWQKGNAPGAWEWMGKLYSYRGQGFMQKTIKLDSSYAKNKSVIRLGQTDADGAVYINGTLISKGNLFSDHGIGLPAGTWKGGDNSILIDLISAQKKPAGYGMGLNGSGNDLYVKFADTIVSLTDGNWHTMPDIAKPYHFDYLPNNSACMLFNSMINPLIPYAIAGVTWYQGESNTDRAYQYRTSFPLMIADWRGRWGRQLPFLFVQLSSFGGEQSSNKGSDWAELREAQNMTLQLPNTGLAVTTDIGDAGNVHPRDKADVGLRLASKALSVAYHLHGFQESPLFSSADFKDGYALVYFAHAEHGLMAKDKYDYIKGFELAGADKKFYYAQAVVTVDNKVKVWCSQVLQPVSVRYAWTNAPTDANLFSKDGFPVGPFRSDSWKGITEGKAFE